MKNIIYMLIAILMLGCDAEEGLNCFQASGKIIRHDVQVEAFTRVTVLERTQLFVQQGDEFRVLIETGENLLNDIEVTVEDGLLTILNDNGCNIVRDYGLTKVFVTAPNITEIRNSSGLTVTSRGVLAFDNLSLLSEDLAEEDAFHTDGDFNLDLAVNNLTILTTGLSDFTLRGTANTAFFDLNNGDTFIDAGDLIVQEVSFFQRSTDDLIVNPQVSLTGQLVNSGNVISKNEPPLVDVEALYTGNLIFE